MSKISIPVKTNFGRPAAPSPEPGEEAIRDYAYHLYQQGNGAPGNDVANWLEAVACLKAHIPADASHSRLHQHVNGQGKDGALVSSPAMAEREAAVLRREREKLESEPKAADGDVRASLFDDRP